MWNCVTFWNIFHPSGIESAVKSMRYLDGALEGMVWQKQVNGYIGVFHFSQKDCLRCKRIKPPIMSNIKCVNTILDNVLGYCLTQTREDYVGCVAMPNKKAYFTQACPLLSEKNKH